MRVVAGMLRGRRLVAPPGRHTRPTGDRVREAIFNHLTSFDAVLDATTVDLFAGSGALGIEALSRGARACTFVESARPALDALRANLSSLGLRERATVVAADALAWVKATRPDVTLCLADPPYAFDEWAALLAPVSAKVIVAESDREIALPAGFDAVRTRRYGSTVVTIGHCGTSDR